MNRIQRKKHAVALILVIGFFVNACSQNNGNEDINAVTPGTECPEVGISKTYQGKIYTCINLGSKMYWDNGVIESEALPTKQPEPVDLSERQAINLLPVASDLSKYKSLTRFSSSSYVSNVNTNRVAVFTENSDSDISSKPFSCLPVPQVVFLGIPIDAAGSSVNGKIQESFGVTFRKSGQDTLAIFIIKPKDLKSIEAFKAYKVDVSECSRFKWSLYRGFSDTNFALAYQDATSSVTDLTGNSFKGTLKSEIIVVNENCPMSNNFECYADWNASFVMKEAKGYILLASLLNTTQASTSSSRKAQNVSSDEEMDLINLLTDLEAKIPEPR